LFTDWKNLKQLRAELKGKGFRGAVGTSASYAELIGIDNLERFERYLSERLKLQFYEITGQKYPRKQDYLVACALGGLASSLYKFAFDLRLLQTPSIGEIFEPFSTRQVGSSTMPFKRNPINTEKINSLARLLAQFSRLAWDNAAHSFLEMTLDDSANRRVWLPEIFLISDEIIEVVSKIMANLEINPERLKLNLITYGKFSATERILMTVCKRGADRQAMHERLRKHSIKAWKVVQAGGDNPIEDFISGDKEIMRYLSTDELKSLMNVTSYLGDAPKRAREFATLIQQRLA